MSWRAGIAALIAKDLGKRLQYQIWVDRFGFKLEVRFVQDSINTGRVVEESGSNASRNTLQSVTVKDALRELQADAAIGGARRDEEKARAKERFFSRRDAEGHWNPSFQRPELWSYYNGRHFEGEHFRIFPISNWTELDILNDSKFFGIICATVDPPKDMYHPVLVAFDEKLNKSVAACERKPRPL